MTNIINLAHKFTLFDEHWSPRIVGELNDSYVKLAKIQGEFVWHHHADEDELFLVVKGQMLMYIRHDDQTVTEQWIEEGECIIIPRGVEHKPAAEDGCHILLLEPKTTRNTGNVENERTVAAQWI
jgi:mannose-6-phosphate isomerase-like protein (cupin superfamily)